jgi:hypothetical protein
MVWSSDGAYVWKYADGKVAKVPIQIIQRNSDGVLVKAELADGDAVVTQGIQQLADGASVRLLDAPPDAADAQNGDGQQKGGGGNRAQGQEQS